MLSVITSNNHWIPSLKLLLISSAVVSTAAMLKFSVPVVATILVSDVPAIWSSIVFWLRPPYLYLLFNFIIISILAFSKLHQEDQADPPLTTVPKLSADSRVDYTVHIAVGDVLDNNRDHDANESLAVDVNDVKTDSESEESMASVRENDESGEADQRNSQVDYTVHRAVGNVLDNNCDRDTNEILAVDGSVNDVKTNSESEKSMASVTEDEIGEADRLQKDDSMEILLQKYDKKPPISSKVSNRKVAKAAATTTPAGAWSNMNGHDTLDDAWKAITEGRSASFSRLFDKSDTFESGRNSSPPKVKKSETTCNGGKNQESKQAAEARVRRKVSLTEEELNRQVEAFIEKFKEEMRLQREESLKKFQKMTNHY